LANATHAILLEVDLQIRMIAMVALSVMQRLSYNHRLAHAVERLTLLTQQHGQGESEYQANQVMLQGGKNE